MSGHAAVRAPSPQIMAVTGGQSIYNEILSIWFSSRVASRAFNVQKNDGRIKYKTCYYFCIILKKYI